MSNDHNWGNMSEKEQRETEEMILDILGNVQAEDALSTELGDYHTEEMWLLGILEDLEAEGKIQSCTFYQTIE